MWMLYRGMLIVATYIFAPTLIAYTDGKKHTPFIALVNVLLGWTLIGWAGALIWAIGDSVKDLPPFEPSLSPDGVLAPRVPQPSMSA